ncbi:MAG: dihydropteroate synthase [Pseudopedobacter saltans]|uniref:dihydropteroate synthase n=1 Tax=Pseudopedobacter saltans TaxID=151895 RepID=A0A2W5ESI3_9SPHI|nr:MAG: dihydropteroate synthase [Pseudopedobacter saltans]
MFTLNCKGRLLSLEKPIVMGIINATPDSFFTGNRKPEVNAAIDTAGKMLEDGASILDLGGQSTHPSSTLLSAEEEMERLAPVLEGLVKAFSDSIISVDTFYSKVAQATIDMGASIVNDISGGNLDKEMIPTVGAMGNVPYVCMHMRGTPQTMKTLTQYENVTLDILDFFIQKTEECRLAGIKDIIIDPGFGFAKNLEQNYELMRRLSDFRILGKSILVGVSRKGMIYRSLGTNGEEALNGTTIINTIALLNGANILRVHDVKEAMEAIKLVEIYKEK